MAKIIFHLGTYKTGTSSIQNHLFNNRDQLLERGILYPISVVSTDTALGHRHSEMVYRFNRNLDPATPPALMDEVKASDAETVVLSSEAWSAPWSFLHLMRVVNDFKAMGHTNAHAILFLRNVAAYRVSLYREMTCNQGNKQPYDKFIAKRLGRFDYQFLVRFYRALFGDNLRVVAFDGQDSVSSFRSAVGEEHFTGLSLPSNRFNTKSVDAVDVEIYRHLNAAGLDHDLAGSIKASLAPELQTMPDWTERVDGDHEVMPKGYAEDLADLIGWPVPDVETLLQDAPIKGAHVSVLSDAIDRSIREIQTAIKGAEPVKPKQAQRRGYGDRMMRWFNRT